MYLFRGLLKTPAHVSSQKDLTYAGLPGTLSKHINLTTLEGSEKLNGRRRPYRAPGGSTVPDLTLLSTV